jgi:protein gp37
MADNTPIEWTDATWNPITGCSVVSPGCTNCYAMTLAGSRLRHHPSRAGLTKPSKAGPVWTGEVRFNEAWLDLPLRWRRPRMVFVCAHGDLFHESVPDAWIDKVFAVMALSPQHTFQCLTKRAVRMRAYFDGEPEDRWNEQAAQMMHWDDMPQRDVGPLSNVWLGVSAERQQEADARIPDLLATPAAVRFVSLEPLLGPIDLTGIVHDGGQTIVCALSGQHGFSDGDWWEPSGLGPRLDWVIVGGESGKAARPMQLAWARSIVAQCKAAGVACFVKQLGSATGFNLHDRKGGDPSEWAADLRVREMPNAI